MPAFMPSAVPRMRGRQALLVEAVARLVDRAEKGVERLVLVEPRGQAHVVARAGAKRMQRDVDPAAPVVEARAAPSPRAANPRWPATGSPAAGRARAGTGEAAIARTRGTSPRFSSPKSRSTCRRRQAGIVEVQHAVVGRLGPAEVRRLPAGELQVLLQHGRIRRENRRPRAPRPTRGSRGWTGRPCPARIPTAAWSRGRSRARACATTARRSSAEAGLAGQPAERASPARGALARRARPPQSAASCSARWPAAPRGRLTCSSQPRRSAADSRVWRRRRCAVSSA